MWSLQNGQYRKTTMQCLNDVCKSYDNLFMLVKLNAKWKQNNATYEHSRLRVHRWQTPIFQVTASIKSPPPLFSHGLHSIKLRCTRVQHGKQSTVKICHFRESYLEVLLTPWYNITKIPHCGNCLFNITIITISWMLPYHKNAAKCFYHLSQKDNFAMYTHVFQNKKHDRIIKSNITHNPAGENPIWLPLQITYHYRH